MVLMTLCLVNLRMSLTLIILSVALASVECNQWTDTRVVQTDQGLVRGFKYIGEDVISFYNIPYATVTRRFQVAGPPPTWSETFDAFDRKIACPQPTVDFLDLSNHTMQEDCLVMNIFVPDTNERNLPVLVDIHGGAYNFGLGDANKFNNFAASKNVVVVTFNHRVGAFGFLCLGTKNIPGNAGMKDIIIALRWIKRNIANFGGNPDEVTTAGCSSAGAALDLLLLSKEAEGLFNKAIPDSGSNLAAFAVAQDPIEQAKEMARLLNFSDADNIEALEEFFMVTPFETIVSLEPGNRPNTILDYAPCVEKDVGQEMIFLDDAPFNILKSGNFTKYPTMYGLTDAEGILTMVDFEEWSVGMNENFGNYLPGNLKFDNDIQRQEVAERIKQFFFGNATINTSVALQYLNYFSDTMFTYSILRNVKMQVEAGHQQVYLYEYSYYADGAVVPGAPHCAQASAVRDGDDPTQPEVYLRLKTFLRDVWYNFMTTGAPVVSGSPVPSWPPLNQTNRSPHLSVGRQIELRGALLEERANFWDSIYEQYYSVPIPPTIPDASPDHASSITINYVLTIFLSITVYLAV